MTNDQIILSVVVIIVYSAILRAVFAYRNFRLIKSLEVVKGKRVTTKASGLKTEQLLALWDKAEKGKVEPLMMYFLQTKTGNFLISHPSENLIVMLPLSKSQLKLLGNRK